MANPQPTDAHLRIAHSIIEQIMMRKFSLRHRNILDLILRLSWGCGKKVAIIPRLSDFELVGVGRNHVKTELMWLVNVRVINWHHPTNTFEFNKNYDEWLVPPVRKYDPQKLSEVVHLNLVAQVPESGTQFPKQEQSSQNGVFPKQELMQQNGNKVPKKEEPSHPSSPDVPTDSGSLKKVFKESNNNDDNSERKELLHFIQNEFGRTLGTKEMTTAFDWLEIANIELIQYAVEQAVLGGPQKANCSYISGIIQNLLSEKITTRRAAELRDQQRKQPTAPTQPSKPTITTNLDAAKQFIELQAKHEEITREKLLNKWGYTEEDISLLIPMLDCEVK